MTLFGISITSGTDLAAKEQVFGDIPLTRIYFPNAPAASVWTAEAADNPTIVSFHIAPADVLSGANDLLLNGFFVAAPSEGFTKAHPLYYSYWHEPEKAVKNGEFTIAEYVEAWEHIITLANRFHNPFLHSMLILMEYDFHTTPVRPWQSYIPQGLSKLGWDAYPEGFDTLADPSTFIGNCVAGSKEVGIPWGIAEFGTLDVSAGRGPWLTEVAEYVEANQGQFCTLFSTNVGGNFDIMGDPASVTAWGKVMQ